MKLLEPLDKSHPGDETAASPLVHASPTGPAGGAGSVLGAKKGKGFRGAIDGEPLPDLAAGRLLFVFQSFADDTGWDTHRIASHTQTSRLHPKQRAQSPRVAATTPATYKGASTPPARLRVRGFRGQAVQLYSRSLPRPSYRVPGPATR